MAVAPETGVAAFFRFRGHLDYTRCMRIGRS